MPPVTRSKGSPAKKEPEQKKEPEKKKELKKKKKPLEYRDVAGSFLFRFPNGDEKQAQVALFKRSGDVKTYPHMLAPISGSVEDGELSRPIDTALREIKEETGLTMDSLELLRVGKDYSFVDESANCKWTIHPFAFRLLDKHEGGVGEEGITLDWEHEGFNWFDPLDVDESEEFGGVPNLVNSLRRVWPGYHLGPRAAQVLTSGTRDLRDDHDNGARVLAGKALVILKSVIVEMDSEEIDIDSEWWVDVRMAAWHLCQARPSMGAAITSVIITALNNLEEIFNQDGTRPEKIQQMIKAIDDQLEKRTHAIERIRDAFVKYVRERVIRGRKHKKELSILTLSASSTISSCLLQVAISLGVSLDLRILESRPLLEGVTLAATLLKAEDEHVDMRISIYTDAAVAVAVRGIDILLLGADRISENFEVYNKIGSVPATMCCRETEPGAFIIILSEAEKIAPPGKIKDYPEEENGPKEVREGWPDQVEGAKIIKNASLQNRVRLRNTYFEWISNENIDAYISDEGQLMLDDITEKCEWIGSEMKRLFGEF